MPTSTSRRRLGHFSYVSYFQQLGGKLHDLKTQPSTPKAYIRISGRESFCPPLGNQKGLLFPKTLVSLAKYFLPKDVYCVREPLSEALVGVDSSGKKANIFSNCPLTTGLPNEVIEAEKPKTPSDFAVLSGAR
jgi:hypothetical protein